MHCATAIPSAESSLVAIPLATIIHDEWLVKNNGTLPLIFS
jgi:hypothetical protein